MEKKHYPWIALLGAAFALLFFYAPAFHTRFILADDFDLVRIPQLYLPLGMDSLKAIFTPGSHIDFYPVRDLDYLFDLHIWGGSPMVFRIHQMVLFLATVGGLFVLLRLWTLNSGEAGTVVALWAILPFHSEMLCWISARKDILALFYAVLSVIFFSMNLKKTSRVHLICSLLFYLLSILSKASFVLLPFLGLLVLWDKKSRNKKSMLVLLLTGCVLALTSGLFQSWFYSSITDMTSRYGFENRVLGSAAGLGRAFLGLFLWSYNALDWDISTQWLSLNERFEIWGIALWVFVGGGLVWALKRRSVFASVMFGGFILSYVPISGLVFPHRFFYSVRYMEAPFLFLFMGAALVFFKRTPTPYKNILLTIVVAWFFYGDWREGQTWASPVAMYEKGLRLSPESITLRSSLNIEAATSCALGDSACDRDKEYKNSLALAGLCSVEHGHKIDPKGDPCFNFYLTSWAKLVAQQRISDSKPFLERGFASVSDFDPPLRVVLRYSIYSFLAEGQTIPEFMSRRFLSLSWFPNPEYRRLRWALTCLNNPLDARALGQKYISEKLLDPELVLRGINVALSPSTVHTLARCLPFGAK